MLIVGTNIPPNTFIVDYGTGVGGNGTYQVTTNVGATAITGISAVGIPANVQQDPHGLNPINVYSFALNPEEHQPSGTCNFSRIDTTTLVFDSVTTGGDGTFPTKNYPYSFRSYAVNYNIFRIMSGMGGLAYSN